MISGNWKHFNNDGNAFYFILIVLFALRIFKVLSWFFLAMLENSLIKKRLISKFMTSSNGKLNVVEKLVPDSKLIKIEHISPSTIWTFIQFAFIVFSSQGLTKYIKNSADRLPLPCYILSIDQTLLSECLYFWRYWAMCVLRPFVSQLMASQFHSSHPPRWWGELSFL